MVPDAFQTEPIQNSCSAPEKLRVWHLIIFLKHMIEMCYPLHYAEVDDKGEKKGNSGVRQYPCC
jgi:hypothetical protein